MVSKYSGLTHANFDSPSLPFTRTPRFNDRDTQTSPHVAVVNEAFVRRYLAGMSPSGRTIRTSAERGFPETEYEIVGVVKDTKYVDLREPAPPIAFVPADQFPDVSQWAILLIRFSSSPSAASSAVREKIAQLNPAIKTQFHFLQTDVETALNRDLLMP